MNALELCKPSYTIHRLAFIIHRFFVNMMPLTMVLMTVPSRR